MILKDALGTVSIDELGNSCYKLVGTTADERTATPHSPIVTRYPLELIEKIFTCYSSAFTCDEVSRDIDESEAPLDVRLSISAYLDDSILTKSLKILDYGCGAGASTMVLGRLFPRAAITGRDIHFPFLEIATARARHYGFVNMRFEAVDTFGKDFQSNRGTFDIVFLNAVYEHLMPAERSNVLEGIWSMLKPSGYLVLNQTPHRWFPIETHTTGLPLINYLPDRIANWAIRSFSKRACRHLSWNELLRAGVRGASVSEIMFHVGGVDPSAKLLAPKRVASTWSGIWYAAKQQRLEKVGTRPLRSAITLVQRVVERSHAPFSPYVNIAIQKGAGE